MTIAIENDKAASSWVGAVETHPLNPAFKCVKLDNGQFFGVKPDGTRYVDPACSAWQAFAISTNGMFLVARRGTDGDYVVPFVEFTGPAIP